MKTLQLALCFIVITFFIGAASSALAQTIPPPGEVRLGIQIKQGVDPYIADLDVNGLGASSGLLIGDHIKEIGYAPTAFTYQVKAHLSSKKKDKPFNIVVTRGGVLVVIKVDPRKPLRSWIKQKGTDPLSDCYLSPTADCIVNTIMKPEKQTSIQEQFSSHTSNVQNLLRLNRRDLAKSELEKAKRKYFQLPKITYKVGSMVRALHQMGESPDPRLLKYTKNKLHLKNGKVNVSDLLSVTEYFGEAGYKEAAMMFLNLVVDAAKTSPGLIKSYSRRLGRALAATEKNDWITSYLKSKHYKSEWKSKMLEAAFLQYIENEDLKSASIIMNLIFGVHTSKTNEDNLIFIRLFKKAQQDKVVLKMVEQLKHQTEKASPLIRPILARSLVKAYGAIGDIPKGRQTIQKYFSKKPLRSMLDLIIESANSRSSVGSTVQYYKELPQLIAETYALLKKSSAKERKSLRLTIKEFYEVMAAHLKSRFSIQEWNAYGFQWYDYGNLVSALVEVRKYDEAMRFADESQRRFGKSYRYMDIFYLYGYTAPPQRVEILKRHPQYRKHEHFYKRARLQNLYWKGFTKKAADLFPTLTQKEKRISIIQQIPFATVCNTCNL